MNRKKSLEIQERIYPLWLLSSTRSGVTCHPPPGAKHREPSGTATEVIRGRNAACHALPAAYCLAPDGVTLRSAALPS